MKTKIYLVLLLGLLSIKSNAQEQFLKFDSIQVIQGEYLATPSNPFSIHDTVTCPVGGYVQVKYVVLDVESAGSYIYYTTNYIKKFRCKINGISIASIKGSNTGYGTALDYYSNGYESVEKIGLMYDSDLLVNIIGDYDPSSQSNMYFRYRIELHHYSYE
jgi:hypothetical protein